MEYYPTSRHKFYPSLDYNYQFLVNPNTYMKNVMQPDLTGRKVLQDVACSLMSYFPQKQN